MAMTSTAIDTQSAASESPTQAADDLEKIPVEQVLTTLAVKADQGLTGEQAQKRLAQYGPNAIVAKEKSLAAKIIGYFLGPIAYMIEAAALVSAILGHWQDFIIISALLIFNAVLDLWQDMKASNALAALKKGLAPEATALRDGKWDTVDAATLVPGDIVKIRLGMIVPADLRMVSGDYAAIDQAALTGESLPVAKKVGDEAYSGSVVKQGEMEGVVIGTGGNTFFGRTAKLVAGAGSVSHAQKAMFQIGNFLIIVAVVLAAIMVAFRVYHDMVIADNWGLADALNILQFVLILLVASIPVAMPAVFSITMALGALALSKRKAIVSRLEAIEEMAGVDILCSDKTGTLTKNQLKLGDPILLASKDPQEVILAAALASKIEDRDAIDTAVIEALRDQTALKAYKQTKFVPFDPVTKRTAATLSDAQGKAFVVSKGAPQAIVDLAKPAADVADKVKQTVDDLAGKGFRALGVARSEDNGSTWAVLGVLPMFDPPRDDSKATIDMAAEKGVRVKMITGDDTAIARETARQLGMGANIIPAADAFPKDMDPNHVPPQIAEAIETADGFARVFPEHKYAIVKALQGRGHLVAMTGDGVNDAPALKQADCGTAVSGATDAARGAAALILTAPGLSVINNAIDEARRIFGRITTYTIYRVALTMDIMFLVVMSTIFLGFQPLTAIMIVVMSLLDDIPIMTIAYDNTPVSERPIRWKMPRLLGVSTVLGFFSVVQSFGLLLIGMEVLSNPHLQQYFGLHDKSHLQTVMFLQLVAGGHLLLFVTRTERWFFMPPFPAAPLFIAIVLTQILAVLMCAFGWLVPPISWEVIGWVWAYNIAWMFVLGAVRLTTEKLDDHRTARHLRSGDIVTQSLQPHVPAGPGRVRAT
jgi:H+-transporting ATPase